MKVILTVISWLLVINLSKCMNSFSTEEQRLIAGLLRIPETNDLWFETFLRADLHVITHLVNLLGPPRNSLPLALAAYRGRMDIMDYLVYELALVPSPFSEFLLYTDNRGNLQRYLHCGSRFSGTEQQPLDMAAAGGSLEMVKFCEEKLGCSASNPKCRALELAATKGHFEIFEHLSATPNIKLNGLLYFAVRYGNSMEIVQFLVDEKGIKPSDLDAQAACETGNLEMFKYLIQFPNVDLLFSEGNVLPVAAAVASGNLEMVKYLVEVCNMHRTCCDCLVLNNAVGNFTIFRYLVENGCEKAINMNTFRLAFENVALDTVKYLTRNYGFDPMDLRSRSWFAISIQNGASEEFTNFCVHELGVTLDFNEFNTLALSMLHEESPYHHNLEMTIRLWLKLHPDCFEIVQCYYDQYPKVHKILESFHDEIEIDGLPIMVYLNLKLASGDELIHELLPLIRKMSPRCVIHILREAGKPGATKMSVIRSLVAKERLFH